jgi:hypothetical protein
MPLRRFAALTAFALFLPLASAGGQQQPVPIAGSVKATLAEEAPVIDGRDDDAVWRKAPAITGFRVVRPTEDGDPHFRTEAKVAYDSRALYIFVRAYDAHPDSIVALMSRRDVSTPSDLIAVLVDSYHDRRTGYEFDINPAGVKVDYAISQDGNEDLAWDGVWDVATRIDSLGWTAEYRIPLAQLRYVPNGNNTFGIAIWRTVERTGEQAAWPLYRMSRPGLASQLGDLVGLENLSEPERAEIAPYVVTRNVQTIGDHGYGRNQQLTGGADLQFALAPNVRLIGTINPDFGQVEADPAVLNLSAFETFFPEKRPFFVEGSSLFQLNVNCSAVSCSNEELFYSRRIGRDPELGGSFGGSDSPNATTILGAAKLTGRSQGGLSVGAIDAVTARESGINDATIEPATNYAVLRATQDLGGGTTSFGAMFTGVNRALDRWTDTALSSQAYVGALEARHQFLNRRFELSASLDLSHVGGSTAAISSLQRDDVHLYQRPDGPLVFDSTRTSLDGDAEEVHFGKIGGRRTMFETSYLRRSPGFEINDIGYLRQADQQSWNNWFAFIFNSPNRVTRSVRWNLNWWEYWTAAGLPTERAANTNVHLQLANYWWVHAGGTVGQLGQTWCDRCARGGPAVRQDPYVAPWATISGDDRHKIIPTLSYNGFESSSGRNGNVDIMPSVTLNASPRVSASVGADWSHAHTDNQWYGNFDVSGVEHYTFAHLDQHTLSLTADLGYTFTPTLTVQWHLQPFVSRGTYANLRELANPGAEQYDARYQPYADTAVTNHLGGFDSRQFNSNFVVRWEYRRGSTLFLVWTQGRNGFDPAAGPNGLSGDLRTLFAERANNTFLVKVSYWLNR